MDHVILCACSAYEEKYYLNRRFDGLPESVKEELQIMCVLYTAEVGGILTLEFDEEGALILSTSAKEGDLLYDEIGSVLKVKEIRKKKQELLESLELYYRAFFLHEDLKELLEE